jgi:hypothetical protein
MGVCPVRSERTGSGLCCVDETRKVQRRRWRQWFLHQSRNGQEDKVDARMIV